MNYEILNTIKSPQDVKKLSNSQITVLCEEIRDCIINTVSQNGGHLAANLGSVELTVAVHRAFDSPQDAIIFDVGHQCYTHKLLTGRFEDFKNLRKEDGLSGFMKPKESEHDPIITGHSSNSISAAYGIYRAKKLKGEEGSAVAIIGDGALTGGMAYEALNHAGDHKGNFIVILNDNEMSISQNVGGMSKSLTKMRNKTRYHRFKFAFGRFLNHIPLVGHALYKFFYRLKEIFKSIVYKNNIFSAFGFNYLGPVDGHNVKDMESLFKIAKCYQRPTVIHVVTTKGKGYSFAEQSPNSYHGVSPFDATIGVLPSNKITFSDIAGRTLCEMAENDDKICAVTAAMESGTGLSDFAAKYPDRFFDVGIAEQHAVTFTAGLAKGGMKPYFAVYSSFLQRAYDQIIHDCAIGNVPLTLLVDRAGIVGEDGETHQGLFDVSFLTSIPNITVYSPTYYDELVYAINLTALQGGVNAIRYPRGCEVPSNTFKIDFKGDYTVLNGNGDRVVITYGKLFSEALKAKEADESITLIKLNKIFPISDALVLGLKNCKKIDFYEESVKSGGIGEHLSALLLENGFKGEFIIHAVNNEFVPMAKTDAALKKLGLDYESMLRS
ncbi:MAG: 1-deoxy-D-xylulose-5-phosphate synthase [Ruminococcaceae bacterium]|nr:1-deoxy-D-xylulose-5-phosphate synthase [Oscillospiraceae bacterium]